MLSVSKLFKLEPPKIVEKEAICFLTEQNEAATITPMERKVRKHCTVL